MKKRLGLLAATAALAIGGAVAPVSAAPDPTNSSGACHAFWVTYYVGIFNDEDSVGNGLKAVADYYGYTVKEVQEILKAFCA
jgi:hypothetical protein